MQVQSNAHHVLLAVCVHLSVKVLLRVRKVSIKMKVAKASARNALMVILVCLLLLRQLNVLTIS